MLKNSFRKLTGALILGVFGLAVWRYFAQTSGDPYVWGALGSGLKLLLLLGLVLWVAWLFDRKMKRQS